jgi:hypothetical protein
VPSERSEIVDEAVEEDVKSRARSSIRKIEILVDDQMQALEALGGTNSKSAIEVKQEVKRLFEIINPLRGELRRLRRLVGDT